MVRLLLQLFLPEVPAEHPPPGATLLRTPFKQIATQVVGSLLALEAMDEEEDIRLYINSTGEGASCMRARVLPVLFLTGNPIRRRFQSQSQWSITVTPKHTSGSAPINLQQPNSTNLYITFPTRLAGERLRFSLG